MCLSVSISASALSAASASVSAATTAVSTISVWVKTTSLVILFDGFVTKFPWTLVHKIWTEAIIAFESVGMDGVLVVEDIPCI